MKTGIIIYTDGKTERIELTREDGSANTARFQKAVEGYLEAVGNSHQMTIFANEDGQRLNLTLNRNASLLCERTILGNVVCVGLPDWHGDTTSLTPEQIELIERF